MKWTSSSLGVLAGIACVFGIVYAFHSLTLRNPLSHPGTLFPAAETASTSSATSSYGDSQILLPARTPATTASVIPDTPSRIGTTAPPSVPQAQRRQPDASSVATPQAQDTALQKQPSAEDTSTVSQALAKALVNILCYAPSGSSLHSISGSGIIISPSGYVLTNAHVAAYFLLNDRNVSCTLRSGSPAVNRYDASLVFISPKWISENAGILSLSEEPSGTGEHDLALLAITKSATDEPLPGSFPFVPLATVPPAMNTPVVIASYGAQFLQTAQIESSLFPTIVAGSVKNIYTFGTDTADIMGLGGSAAAQEGSSGGGVADLSGNLIGTITTSTVEGATNTRSLDAITASYVRADYASETGRALDLLLSEAAPTAVAAFSARIIPLEAALLQTP